nr:uncharacterized protein LOC129281866 [Lytechinus pictus]
MHQGSGTEDPVKWSTRLVLAWMRSYDDSREEVKKKILEVVETNDIDGLTLKQLRADSEEIHTLFPSLKDRLTFKAMLRDMFKDARCSHCHSNGVIIGNTCNHDPPAQKPTQATPHIPQLSSKTIHTTQTVANHRSAASHTHIEEANHKPSGHVSRTSPLLSPRPHTLPRQDSKENTQSVHPDNGPPSSSRSKMPPLAVAMVPNTQPVISPRERELNSAQMHRYIPPQSIHGNQMIPHGGPAVSFPFAPIAGQFNVTVANQALAAALAARALPHQQPYQQHQQSIVHCTATATTAGSSQASTSRPTMLPPPNHHHHHRTIAAAPTSAPPPPPPTVTQRIVEILSKDDKDLSVASTSTSSPSEHPQNSQEPTSTQVPVTMPLIGSRGRPATKGAIRSAKISQKYKKIIQRMKSAHKQVIEIPYPAPLPSFSQLLRQQIGRGNIANFRSRFTYECAQYYMSLNPTPSHTEYRNISKTIVENFPVLSSPDEDVPWRKFNNQLSQAIRNIRRQLRSVPNSGYPPAQKRKYWRNLASQFMCNTPNGMTSLSQLTQQQQEQLGLVGTSGEHSNDDDDDDDDDDDNIIILKEEDDGDDDERGDGRDGENDGGDADDGPYDDSDDDDDSVVPAEWINKRE